MKDMNTAMKTTATTNINAGIDMAYSYGGNHWVNELESPMNGFT